MRKRRAAVAPIPRIDPAEWEEHEGFRETLLLHVTESKANVALRNLGAVLFDMALECAHSWPHQPEGDTRAELRAALADLRHLEGFLTALGQEHIVSSLEDEDAALSRFAARQAIAVGRIADRIEEELGERKD
jgi:hypothetical protein